MAVAPLYTTPYDPSYGTARMSELVRRRGDIQAQSALAQGAARAQMGNAIGQGVSGLMSDLVRYSQVQQEQKRRDEELGLRKQLVESQLSDREMARQARAAEDAFTAQWNEYMQAPDVTPEDVVAWAKSKGRADKVPELLKRMTDIDAGLAQHQRLAAEQETLRRELLADAGKAIDDGGNTVDVAMTTFSRLVKKGALKEDDVTPYLSQVARAAAAGQEAVVIKDIATKLMGQSSRYAPKPPKIEQIDPTKDVYIDGVLQTPGTPRPDMRVVSPGSTLTRDGKPIYTNPRAPSGEGGKSTAPKPEDYREAAAKKDRAIKANEDKANMLILQERNRRLKLGATDAVLAKDTDFQAFKTDIWNQKQQQDLAAIEAYRSETGWTPDWRERQGGRPPITVQGATAPSNVRIQGLTVFLDGQVMTFPSQDALDKWKAATGVK